MIDKRNNFVCFGAVHTDYILRLKTEYFKNRTNPINQSQYLGGVAYNISEKLAFLNYKIVLISFNLNKVNVVKIQKNNIFFKPISKKIYDRYYTAIINKKGEMILGMANMDNYEIPINLQKISKMKNKKIIFDLNFSKKTIEYLISKYFTSNKICVSGTSAHKIYKIKNLLSKINILILNKQESLNLSNKKNINDALNFIIKKNKDLTLVITNGKNYVKAYHNKIIYSCKPPLMTIINENKAGDVMSAFFYHYFFKNLNFNSVLSKSIAAGSLHVSGFTSSKINYLKKIEKLSKNINVNMKVSNV